MSESKEIPLQTEYIQEALCEELQEPGIEDSDTIEQANDVLNTIEKGTVQPDTGNIVIDELDKGDYHFHFE